jgi:hypothetical protein
MDWRWTARRLVISAFLIFHLSLTALWSQPTCPIKLRLFDTASYYMFPLGLWQYWGMFAPDPPRENLTLEAEVFDAQGLRYEFSFPRLADYTVLQGVTKFRHSKFASSMSSDDFIKHRKITAKHVVRQLGLSADAFPVRVALLYHLRAMPQPGGPPEDPLAPTRPYSLGTYTFAKLEEVRP